MNMGTKHVQMKWAMAPAPRRPGTNTRDIEAMTTPALREMCKARRLPTGDAKKKQPARDQMIGTLIASVEIDVIEDAGAVGDGVADDSLAIQSAMNAMRDGQVLRFPPGRYLVEHLTLPAGVDFTLAGPEADGDDKKAKARGRGILAVLQLKETGQFIFSTAALPVIRDDLEKKTEEKKEKTMAQLMEETKERERQRDMADGKEVEEVVDTGPKEDTDSVCGGDGLETVPGDSSTIENLPTVAPKVLRKFARLRHLTLEGPPLERPAEIKVGGIKCQDSNTQKQAWTSKLAWQHKGGGNTAFPASTLNGSRLSSGTGIVQVSADRIPYRTLIA